MGATLCENAVRVCVCVLCMLLLKEAFGAFFALVSAKDFVRVGKNDRDLDTISQCRGISDVHKMCTANSL